MVFTTMSSPIWESISKLYSLVSFFYLENDWDRIAYQKLLCFQIRGDNG